jgi:hypothetical protein
VRAPQSCGVDCTAMAEENLHPNTPTEAVLLSPKASPNSTLGGTTKKKRIRSEESKARESDVSSKKNKTYKLYQILLKGNWIKHADDAQGLEGTMSRLKSLDDNFDVRVAAEDEKRRQLWATEAAEREVLLVARERKIHDSNLKDIERSRASKDSFVDYASLKIDAETMRANALQVKVEALKAKEMWSNLIAEQRGLNAKHDDLKCEVKELRKLKYAQTRKSKGQVGCVYVCHSCSSEIS